MPQTPKIVIKDYLINSSFHGLRFIADDERHWTERCFWGVCVLVCWYASGLLILASWNAFQNSAISFVMETTYRDWSTDFPTVAVCENDNLDRVYQISDKIWPPEHELELEEMLRELAYYRGLTFYTLQYCNKENADPLCPRNNFTYLANLVRTDCKDSIESCKFNGKAFDCCGHFKPIETDIGRCYIMNSIQTTRKSEKYWKYDMQSDRKSQNGVFSMDVKIPATVYILGEEEVPTITTKQSDFFTVSDSLAYRRHIAITNIVNDPFARETTPIQRNCKYQDENDLDVYPYYSYSACIVQCRKDNQKKLCNCTDHFMPNTPEEEKCGMEGLVCLNKYFSDLSVLRPKWANRHGLVCDCLPSCTEIDITVIKDDKTSVMGKKSPIDIQLEYLPHEKFKRNVVRSRLDLVVSTGGTTGLFVGASLLSFIELIYYLTIRYYGTSYKEQHPDDTPDEEGANVKTHIISEKQNLAIVDIKRSRSALHKWQP